MDTFLQLWGGLFYLLAKIFLSMSEGDRLSSWRLRGWISYLIGVPAWIIVLVHNRNWIATAIELGGVPSMVIGIIYANKQSIPCSVDRVTRLFVFLLVIIGLFYSLYKFGGITTFLQILEIGITLGYLIGVYLLSKNNPRGWLWFILMNTSMGILMGIQNKWIFLGSQVLSLVFVINGYRKSKG